MAFAKASTLLASFVSATLQDFISNLSVVLVFVNVTFVGSQLVICPSSDTTAEIVLGVTTIGPSPSAA